MAKKPQPTPVFRVFLIVREVDQSPLVMNRTILAVFDSSESAGLMVAGRDLADEAVIGEVVSAKNLIPWVELAQEAGATDVWSHPQCEATHVQFLQREPLPDFLARLKQQASQEEAAG
jgi:hypothetical protein